MKLWKSILPPTTPTDCGTFPGFPQSESMPRITVVPRLTYDTATFQNLIYQRLPAIHFESGQNERSTENDVNPLLERKCKLFVVKVSNSKPFLNFLQAISMVRSLHSRTRYYSSEISFGRIQRQELVVQEYFGDDN